MKLLQAAAECIANLNIFLLITRLITVTLIQIPIKIIC